jgi:hypothetical protein
MRFGSMRNILCDCVRYAIAGGRSKLVPTRYNMNAHLSTASHNTLHTVAHYNNNDNTNQGSRCA